MLSISLLLLLVRKREIELFWLIESKSNVYYIYMTRCQTPHDQWKNQHSNVLKYNLQEIGLNIEAESWKFKRAPLSCQSRKWVIRLMTDSLSIPYVFI